MRTANACLRARHKLDEESRTMDHVSTIHITLGDLIAALTEEIVLFVADESEANLLVAYVLSNLLSKQQRTLH